MSWTSSEGHGRIEIPKNRRFPYASTGDRRTLSAGGEGDARCRTRYFIEKRLLRAGCVAGRELDCGALQGQHQSEVALLSRNSARTASRAAVAPAEISATVPTAWGWWSVEGAAAGTGESRHTDAKSSLSLSPGAAGMLPDAGFSSAAASRFSVLPSLAGLGRRVGNFSSVATSSSSTTSGKPSRELALESAPGERGRLPPGLAHRPQTYTSSSSQRAVRSRHFTHGWYHPALGRCVPGI
mmetsp:Transcript_2958/g.5311  ORF Transcript_2958/g.5311 Transcript_2958/m.5311 type:complete len:240 (+) Transcript_2958:71-790(+)